MRQYNYKLRHFSEIYDISKTIAAFFPKSDEVQTGIYELLFNALEHGNLGIGYKLKGKLLAEDRWEQEILKRLNHPDNKNKYVHISVVRTETVSSITIVDQGRGFNWNHHLNKAPSHEHRYHGRGIHIARACGLEPLFFNKPGNEVTCIMVHQKEDILATV